MTTSTEWNDIALWLSHIDWPTAAVLIVIVALVGFVLGYISGVDRK